MLPQDWLQRPLGDIAQITSGGTPDRSTPSYWGGDIPWLTTGEIQFNIITDSAEKITELGLKNSSAKLFPPGTLLMAMYGQGKTRGQIAKLGIEATTNQACAAILFDKKNDPDFYFQYLASKYEDLRELGNAGTQKNLNGGILKRILVPVPPVHEQRRIAHILSTWDQAIATAEQQLTSSRRYAEVLRSALLSGQRRFGDYAPWQSKPLSKMIRESRVTGSGGDVAKKITVKLYGRGVVGKSDKRAGSESTRYYRRSAGQFIYSKLDFLNGAFGRIPAALDGYESTLDLPAFDFLPGIDPRWFLHYVSREAFYAGHLGLANGGRKARRVNPNDLLRVSIPTPCLEEQARIADAIDTALSLVTTQEKLLKLLRQEKSALMTQLLTGKRRVRLPSDKADPT
ncbi:restriction endonuclease subunit S [Xanthomonas sacchari]|uniref:restriction endonuclease subunit S n=1 Tax=Xanthomonas sacchari TaxID=56458 RepID=UPI0035280A26